MTTPPGPEKPNTIPEKPNTYVVQDRANQEELRRIEVQNRLAITGMGGVLPEQPDPTIFHSILDVGCGTGGWLIEVAKTIPTATQLVGVDVSHAYIGHARAQAEAAGVSDRVEFRVMDALLILDFRSKSFDLVNHRFASGWLRTWDWPKLLSEYRRVCCKGGVVRVAEPEVNWEMSSPARSRLGEVFIQAMHQAGYLFTPARDGVTGELARLLRQHGMQDVQERAYAIECRSDSPGGQNMLENTSLAYRTMLPFLRKWTKVPDDYEQLCQQALSDMQQPDYMVIWNVRSAWGTA
jgi:ubiquinone/menaquinone biosynthesis C-methylase UbiE